MDNVLQKRVDELEAKVNKLSSKPKSSYKAKAPYYKQFFALELKPVVDQMAVDKQPRLILFEDNQDLTKHSLYNKINQSFQYLVNHLDPSGIYATLRDEIKIKPETSGIRLKFKDVPKALIARVGVPEEEKPKKVDPIVDKIKVSIAEFFTDEKQNYFLCKNINLTHKQVMDIIEFLNSYKTDKFFYNAVRKSIRIVKGI